MERIPLTQLGPREWQLERDYLSPPMHGFRVFVPDGFLTDLSSTPRFLWSLVSPFDQSTAAPLVHDRGYNTKGKLFGQDATTKGWCYREFTRAQIDNMYKYLMEHEGVVWWRRVLCYAGVRVGGYFRWGK